MTDAWGGSWADSWNGTWGTSTPPPPTPTGGEVGAGGGSFGIDPRQVKAYQERQRELQKRLLDRRREDRDDLRRIVTEAIRGPAEAQEALAEPTEVGRLAAVARDEGLRYISLADVRSILMDMGGAGILIKAAKEAQERDEEDIAMVVLLT